MLTEATLTLNLEMVFSGEDGTTSSLKGQGVVVQLSETDIDREKLEKGIQTTRKKTRRRLKRVRGLAVDNTTLSQYDFLYEDEASKILPVRYYY